MGSAVGRKTSAQRLRLSGRFFFKNEMGGAANASSLTIASIQEDLDRSLKFGVDTNNDVLQCLCLLCAFVDIVLLYNAINCLFTQVKLSYYRTVTPSGPGYSSVLTLGPSNFAMDRRYCSLIFVDLFFNKDARVS